MGNSHSFSDLTEVKQSTIHGLGLFAKQRIPKGSIWWKGIEGDNIILMNEAQYQSLHHSADNSLKASFWSAFSTYSYYSEQMDCLILCLDNARYVNHSDFPNAGQMENGDPLVSIALRDIEAGEEIFESYDEYDKCPWAEVLKFSTVEY